MSYLTRSRAGILIGLGLAFGLALWARGRLDLELHPESVRDFVAGLGIWGPLVYVALVSFRQGLGLPNQVLLLAGGICFDLLPGIAYGALGLTLSGLLMFALARAGGRVAVEKHVPARLRATLAVSGGRAGAGAVALLTGYPFGPITPVQLLAGVTGMGLGIYLLAVAVGSPVRAAAYALFGSSLLAGDPRAVLVATAGLAATAVLPLCVPRTRRWLLEVMRSARAAPPR